MSMNLSIANLVLSIQKIFEAHQNRAKEFLKQIEDLKLPLPTSVSLDVDGDIKFVWHKPLEDDDSFTIKAFINNDSGWYWDSDWEIIEDGVIPDRFIELLKQFQEIK